MPVFSHIIRPMLTTVRMHPLLVTHSRDMEKSNSRWRRQEIHDVAVDAARYSLLPQEMVGETDDDGAVRETGAPRFALASNIKGFATPGKFAMRFMLALDHDNATETHFVLLYE